MRALFCRPSYLKVFVLTVAEEHHYHNDTYRLYYITQKVNRNRKQQ